MIATTILLTLVETQVEIVNRKKLLDDSLLLMNLGGVLPPRTCCYACELWEQQHCITYYIYTVCE